MTTLAIIGLILLAIFILYLIIRFGIFIIGEIGGGGGGSWGGGSSDGGGFGGGDSGGGGSSSDW
jgi:uncharacterized protein